MSKIKNLYILDDPIIFVEKALNSSRRNFKINKIIFVLINIFAMLMTFATLTITAIIISKIFYDEIPSWYFYATTVVSASVAFASSIANFFYVKDNMNKYKKEKELIIGEIIKFEMNSFQYKNNKEKELQLYKNVSKIIGIKRAIGDEDE
ncbi:MAG: DUF4231 domain-containing protein [Mycoplasma sp.]|nr:DUF4231 domain-containing protein [Mycoplasma sp.]